MKGKIVQTILITLTYLNVFAQPSDFSGTLLFNLTETENSWNPMSADEIVSRNISFLSFKKNSTLKYDSINNALSYTTDGYEINWLAIVYKKDTIYIDYPSVKLGNSVFVKAPIPLNGKSFSFFNENTYDAMHSNCRGRVNTVFYLCDACFISKQYEMPEKTKMQIRKKYLTNNIKLQK